MATEFKLPELGEDIESGDVISILVSVGDTVSEEQPVMEIETDKATIEVPAPVSGTIKEIHVRAGEKVKVGQLLFTIDEGAEGEEEKKVEAKVKVKEKEEEKIEAEEEEEEKKEKAEVKAKEEREEAKAKPKVKAREEEREEEGKREEEKKVEAEVKEEEEEREEKKKPREKAAPKEQRGEVVEFSRPAKTTAEPETPRELAPAAPSVRRLARELGIDINQVPGSGPGGRISEEDVKNYARWIITRGTGLGTDVQPKVAPTPLPDFTKWGEVERQPMTNVRRKTAERISSAWTIIPHVTQHDKADITNLEKLRKDFGKKAEEAGGKLTITAILLKVVASALKVFPHFNASVDMANEEIIYKKYYHIGVAVDTDRGLFVPVIRDVDKKNIIELSVELIQMSEKARNRKITLEEMKGGTFTISNQGSIGGTYFSPIIYWPEVAILGISRSKIEPVFTNGQFEPRLMLPFSLSHDHRVIDGADAVRFLRWVVEALEEPFRLILEG